MKTSKHNKKSLKDPELSPFQDELAMKDYSVKSIIGKGAFGTVYEVVHHDEAYQHTDRYAAKYIDFNQSTKEKIDLLKEYSIMLCLQEEIGFPSVYDYFVQGKKEFFLMSLLGSSLEKGLQECGGVFSLKTVLMIGYQALERLESLHSIGFIHRDVKPENFMIGSNGSSKKIIHLIDFGLSCSYLKDNKKHIEFQKRPHLTGTLYYLSVYGHLGIQATRRDDLISLGFMLVHLFKGKLPWINAKGSNKQEILEAIYQAKSTCCFKKLCEKMPEEFVSYFEYCLKLKFFEKPDYCFLKELLIKMMNDNGIQNDGDFDWISRPVVKGINLSARKITSPSPNVYMKKIFDSECVLDL